MTDVNSSADRHLIELIRSGDADGWAQFVSRYQGRMLAFARRQAGANDAEDLVQEAFMGMLRSLDSYRGQSDLQSWLFRILRRRIIDHYRQQGRRHEVLSCEIRSDDSAIAQADPIANTPASIDTPSVIVRQAEQSDRDDARLTVALNQVVQQLQQRHDLRDLKILEGLFYAGVSNRQLAGLMSLDEKQIALVKHRLLKRLKVFVSDASHDTSSEHESLIAKDLLSRIWERERPSCPKRTTLGKSLIGILDPDWQQYVAFHVQTLGCCYCQANLDDLQVADDASVSDAGALRQRIFDSTIGLIAK